MASPSGSPHMMYDSPTTYCCRQVRCIPQAPPPPPKPCKIILPPKAKPGVFDDLRRLNFFNLIGDIITIVALIMFILTFLELLIFHYITSHQHDTSAASVNAETTESQPESQAGDGKTGTTGTSEQEEGDVKEPIPEDGIVIEDDEEEGEVVGENAIVIEDAAPEDAEEETAERVAAAETAAAKQAATEEEAVAEKTAAQVEGEEGPTENTVSADEEKKIPGAKKEVDMTEGEKGSKEREETEEGFRKTEQQEEKEAEEEQEGVEDEKEQEATMPEDEISNKEITEELQEKETDETRPEAVSEASARIRNLKLPFRGSRQAAEDGQIVTEGMPAEDQVESADNMDVDTTDVGKDATLKRDQKKASKFQMKKTPAPGKKKPSLFRMKRRKDTTQKEDQKKASKFQMKKKPAPGEMETDDYSEISVSEALVDKEEDEFTETDEVEFQSDMDEYDMSTETSTDFFEDTVSGTRMLVKAESAEETLDVEQDVPDKSATVRRPARMKVMARSAPYVKVKREGKSVAHPVTDTWMHRTRYDHPRKEETRGGSDAWTYGGDIMDLADESDSTADQKRILRVIRDDRTKIKLAPGDRMVVYPVGGLRTPVTVEPGEQQSFELKKGDEIMLKLAGGNKKTIKLASGDEGAVDVAGDELIIKIGKRKRIVVVDGAAKPKPGQKKGGKRTIQLGIGDTMAFVDGTARDASGTLKPEGGEAGDASGKFKPGAGEGECRKAGGIEDGLVGCRKDASKSYFWHLFWGDA